MNTDSTPTALAGIVYYSRATQPFDEAALQALSEQSSQNNAKVGVTGLLLSIEGHFMQFIEGKPGDLFPLFEKISRDERHTVTRHFVTETLAARLFPNWNMRWLRDEDLHHTNLHVQLAKRFEQRKGVSEAAQAADIWRLVDGLSVACQSVE